jgi:putative SOS response-associated peptidase YedK
MCGRFGLHHAWQTTSQFLYDQFLVELNEKTLTLPTYNVAPTNPIITLIHDGTRFRGGLTNWGFKMEGLRQPMVNARSETILEKTLFRQSLKTKRCLILASGFYEWQRTTKPSNTFWFYDHDKPFLVFAGIYQSWIDEHQTKHVRSAMLTTAANDLMKPIHDRIPVMLNPDQYRHWVHPKTPVDELTFLYKPTNFPNLAHYQVSSYVNLVKHNDPQCIEAIKK